MSAETKAGVVRQRVSPGAPLEERILLHSDRSGECWLWTAAIDPRSGYGRATVEGKVAYAHRMAYEAFVGEIPDGLHIDHLCRVRSCVNPFHLEAVTPQENVLRGMSPGAKALRREVCMYGHSYDEHGGLVCGRRICRLCKRTYLRLYRSLSFAETGRRKAAGKPVVDLAAYFAAERRDAA